ncbi:MAG: DUF5698 domain-containing protein [Methanomicrobiales archaeon]|nr:DUF5698 domain-containing protein [Methanomicrobiales archaeon]
MEETEFFRWVVLPLVILSARIVETSLKTIRQVYIARGFKYLAAAVGTGEISVWLLSTGIVLFNLTNPVCLLAYIAGYAIGTVIGIEMENRIKLGHVIVRIIAKGNPFPMIVDLREQGFGITQLEGKGSFGSVVSVLLVLSPRAKVDLLMDILGKKYPDTIFSVEDIRSLKEDAAIFHRERKKGWLDWLAR